MPIRTWMIYGANGYSAKLIAEHARERRLSPILAGRNADKVKAVADELGLDHRVFGLDDPGLIAENLQDIDAVVHCAGPFSATSAPMLEACLHSKAHYFDISAEIEVLEHAHSSAVNSAAKSAGIVVCPGTGFDVVPTDCIARTLVEELPDATELVLGFQSDMHISPGTARTIVEKLGDRTIARREGVLTRVPLELRRIDFGKGPRRSLCVSWGDVSTAWRTTGIRNISVYLPVNDRTLRQFRIAALLRPLLRLGFIRELLKKQIGKRIVGPTPEQRSRRPVHVWGEVRNAEGVTVTARMTTANGYTVTQLAPVAIVEHLLASEITPGSTTPALMMGKEFAASLEGSSEILISRNNRADSE